MAVGLGETETTVNTLPFPCPHVIDCGAWSPILAYSGLAYSHHFHQELYCPGEGQVLVYTMVQLERSWVNSAILSSLLSVIAEAMDSNTEHNYCRVMDPDMDPDNRPVLNNIMSKLTVKVT